MVVRATTEQPATPLRNSRLKLGLTLRQLAARCSEAGAPIDFSQLARIERGESVPRPNVRATLARLLDLDVTDFERRAS